MSYRQNVTDKQQNDLETAQFDGGIPVEVNGTQRVIARAAQTATYKTSNAGSTLRNNAGVILPHDDQPGRFLEVTQGKA